MQPYLFYMAIFLLLVNPASAGITECISDTIDTAKDVADAVKDAKEVTEFVYDLVTQKYWDGNWDVANREGKPKKATESKDHIRAWIDITGFRNESVINGTRYVDGQAKDFAIVKRDAWHTWDSGMVVVSFESKLVVTDLIMPDGNITTTATQRTDFHWKYKECSPVGGCHWVQVYENLTVSCTVDAPKNLTTRIPNATVYVTFYNRTVAPITHVYVPNENHSSMKDVMIVRYRYNGSNITRYDQIGWIMENVKGTEFVGFIDDGSLPLWIKDENQTVIDHCGQVVTVFDPEFNVSLLNISLHTPYETRYITNYDVKTVDHLVKVDVGLLKVFISAIVTVIVIMLLWRVLLRSR